MRLSRAVLSVLVAVVGLEGGAALAQPPAGDCLIGPGLGSTLLIPYFEVDLTDPFRRTTLFAINNGYNVPVLTRVVLWTDWGVPTLAFDVVLGSWDVQTINLRDVFSGSIPSTGAGAPLDQFPGCGEDETPPYHPNPVIPANERQQLAADHTGEMGSIHVTCGGQAYDDGVARGYVTVDVVDQCSGIEMIDPEVTPANADLPYFAADGGSAGVGIINNTLWGDVFYVDVSGAAAQGNGAISLWADPDRFDGPDVFTFYGRYSGWDGRDGRVPLPWRWDQRFLNGGSFGGGAKVTIWRDSGSPAASRVPCGAHPPWWPLDAQLYAVDESGTNVLGGPSEAFPLATQQVDVDTLGIPYTFGWLQVEAPGSGAWVQPSLTAAGLFSLSLDGTPVEFLCGATPSSFARVEAPATKLAN